MVEGIRAQSALRVTPAAPLLLTAAVALSFAFVSSSSDFSAEASPAFVPPLFPALGPLPVSASVVVVPVRGRAKVAASFAAPEDDRSSPLGSPWKDSSPSSSASPSSATSRRKAIASSVSLGAIGLSAMSASSSPSDAAERGNSEAASIISGSGSGSVGWGIVGLGDVTSVKSGPAFLKCEGSNLAAVMRRTPGKAAEWVRSQDGPNSRIRAYDDVDAFLSDPDLEAVYVSSPPDTHLELCRKVAERGMACYVEKPVGRSGAETRAIAKAFEGRARGKGLYTAYVSRAYERTQAVRRLLGEGVVGDRVTSIRYRLKGTGGARGMDANEGDGRLPWRLRASVSGGGLIMDVGCHVIDRIDYLCGPIVDVIGKAENRGSPWQDVEDYVRIEGKIGPSSKGGTAALQSKGASIDLEWDFSPLADDQKEQPPVDELIIEGNVGALRMAAMSPSLPVEVLDSKGQVIRTLSFNPPQHAAQALIQLVTDELRGAQGSPGQRRCLSRADNAIRTMEVLDAALGAYYGGRGDAFWERPETWPGRPS